MHPNPGNKLRTLHSSDQNSSYQGNDSRSPDSNEGRSRNRYGGQDNGSTHVSNSAHSDQTATNTAAISPVAATTTCSSTDITSHLNQASTTATSRGSTAGTAAHTTATAPGNPKTLQEELPEGGTHGSVGSVR